MYPQSGSVEAKAEIRIKISLYFLGDLKTQKGHFEINSL